jgi:hypothetical protein
MSESTHDAEVVRKRARFLFLAWFAGGAFVLWMVISSALDMVSAWEAHNARANIVDCVVADGKCYQGNQERTAKVVQQLLEDGIARETITRQIIILTEWCDDQPNTDTLNQLERCVNEQLAKERDNE